MSLIHYISNGTFYSILSGILIASLHFSVFCWALFFPFSLFQSYGIHLNLGNISVIHFGMFLVILGKCAGVLRGIHQPTPRIQIYLFSLLFKKILATFLNYRESEKRALYNMHSQTLFNNFMYYLNKSHCCFILTLIFHMYHCLKS